MKPANHEQILLYTLMGEAIFQIQILEQALSHCLTIRLNPDMEEIEANIFLSQQQGRTFGRVVKLAAKEGAYSDELQKALEDLLEQRNWLVHNAMRDSQVGSRIDVKDSILQKIKSITVKAERLQQLLEWDLIDFSKSKGRDVSRLIEMMIKEKGPRPVGW